MNKALYKVTGLLTSFIYLLVVVISLFSVDKFEFFSTIIKVGLLLLTPSIYILFYGIGEIIDSLKDINTVSNKTEEENEEIPEDTMQEDEGEKEEVDENEEVDTDETTEGETSKEVEEKFEPVEKDGKIQCRYCGKFNKIKRTYCYMCAKKLRDEDKIENENESEKEA